MSKHFAEFKHPWGTCNGALILRITRTCKILYKFLSLKYNNDEYLYIVIPFLYFIHTNEMGGGVGRMSHFLLNGDYIIYKSSACNYSGGVYIVYYTLRL